MPNLITNPKTNKAIKLSSSTLPPPYTSMVILKNKMRKNSFDDTLISTPTVTDILCGKDKTFARHQGNQAFRDMIVAYALVYSKATTKQSKMLLTKEIVTTLQQTQNARFLQPSRCGHGWNVISDQVARDKTSHALRFAAKSNGFCATSSDACNKKSKSMAAASASKTHRRQVSWNVSDGSVPSVRMDRTRSPSPLLTQDKSSRHQCQQDDLEPIDWKQATPEPVIFERQQTILKNLADQIGQYNGHYQQQPAAVQYSTPPAVMSRHDFDSLRSEDFESLMNDTTLMNAVGEIPDEWATVEL